MRDPIGEAVARVRAGGLVAYPTETVWGVGADATSEAAVERLRAWKGRAVDAPLSLLVAELSDLEPLEFEVGPGVRELARAFWPGPLTLVIPCRRRFARGIRNDAGGVGVRCSAHPLAAALARRCRKEGVGPLTATSLNRSGSPPARTRQEAAAIARDDGDAPQLIEVEGAEAGGDLETTVVDLAGGHPRVLRQGSVTAAELEPVFEGIVAG